MKVTIGIVNYNRLFYLKSCVESLLQSLDGYPDVEFICIDDNSTEEGTEEYLESLKERGWVVINQEEYRQEQKLNKKYSSSYNDDDHATAFFNALNMMMDISDGDLFLPLQGDMQFIRKGWITDYISLFEERDDVFCATLDAQRRIRLEASTFEKFKIGDSIFAIESGRNLPGAGDCFYKREYLDRIDGWHTSGDSKAEEAFSIMAKEVFYGKKRVFVPWLPPAAAIITDPRGTNGRVRGGKRYGRYFESLEDNLYYEWIDNKQPSTHEHRPSSIEELVSANGDWELPLDENGNWKKLGAFDIDMEDYESI
jgi:glycosyltransferase involved in cell wall biosynthesis